MKDNETSELKKMLKKKAIEFLKKAGKKLVQIAIIALMEKFLKKILRKAKDINRKNNTNEDITDFRTVEEF